MKKQLRVLCTLLLFMVASVGWAEESSITYTFQSKSWEAVLGSSQTHANWTSGKDGAGWTASQGVQVTSTASGANATSPISFENVSKVTVEYCTNTSKGKGTILIQVGEGEAKSFSVSAPSSGGTTIKATEFSFNPTETGNVKITVNCTVNSIYIHSITVVYEENTSGKETPTLTLSEPKDAQGVVMTEPFYVGNDIYIYPETNSGGAITCESSDENVLHVIDWGLTHGDPKYVRLVPNKDETATVTFTVAETETYAERTAKLTFTFVKRQTTCEIIYTGITNTDLAQDPKTGKLVGKVTDSSSNTRDSETYPQLFEWASSDPNVATIAEDGTVTLVGAGATTITCNYLGDNVYATSSATYELTVTNSAAPAPITLWSEDFSSYSADDVPSGGTYGYACTSTTKIYENELAGGQSPELLVAKNGGTFTAVVPLNNASGQLTLTYKTNAKAMSVSTTTEGVNGGGSFVTAGEHTVTFSGVTTSMTSITIVFTATSSDNVRLDDIELIGSAEVNAVEAPTFSINGGTYYTPQTVELECTTEGAAIKYSFDGTTWNDYTGVLTISETKTIYAKAVKEGKESTVSYIEVIIAEKNAVVFNIGNKTLAVGESYTVTFGTSNGKDVQSDGYVTLESNNAVVTINNTKITAAAVGTSTITISVAEGNTYQVGTKTITVTVPAPEGQSTAPTSAGTIFEEHFNDANGTGGNENPEATVENLWSGNIASSNFISDNDGWTYPSNNNNPLGYVGYQCAKFGNGKNNGYATTPEITATEGNTYTLTFKAAPWATEGATMTVTAEGATISGISEDAMTAGQWNDFTATITTTASTFKLTFDASENRFFLDEVVITDPNAGSSTFSVELNASGYATYCNQYPLDFTGRTDVTAWILTGFGNDDDVYKMNYSKITAVKGGVGMLLKGEANATVEIESVDCGEVPTPNLFVGTLAPTFVGAGEVYGLKGDTFKKSQAGIVKPYKAFISAENIPNLDEAKSFVFVFEDEATGVRTIETVSAEDAKAIFNIAGQRQQKMQKGINIVGGKKILVK